MTCYIYYVYVCVQFGCFYFNVYANMHVRVKKLSKRFSGVHQIMHLLLFSYHSLFYFVA